MSKRFTKVTSSLWRSTRFNGLSDDGKLAFLFFLTCEHNCSAGAYALPDGYALSDLNWSADRYGKARAELVAAEAIAFDPNTSEYFIPGWFRHCPPMNKSHEQGILRMLSEIESPQIAEMAQSEFDAAYPIHRDPPKGSNVTHELLKQRGFGGGRA